VKKKIADIDKQRKRKEITTAKATEATIANPAAERINRCFESKRREFRRLRAG